LPDEQRCETTIPADKPAKPAAEGIKFRVCLLADEGGKRVLSGIRKGFDEADGFSIINVYRGEVGFVSNQEVFFSAVKAVYVLPDQAAK